MNETVELLERRRDLLRVAVKDSRAIEAILLSKGKQLEYERLRQITLDAEAELLELESEISQHTQPSSADQMEFRAFPSECVTHSAFREGFRES